MTPVSVRTAAPTNAAELARRTAAGVLVAVVGLLVANGLVTLADFDVGPTGPENPFAATPLVASTVVAGAGAAVAYAVLDRVTDRPVRNFVALAAAVFAVMLVPVLVFSPSLDVTPVGQAVLVVFHAVAAVPIVAFVVGAVSP